MDLRAKVEELIRGGRHLAAVAACDEALAGDLTNRDRSLVLQLKVRALVSEDGRWKGPAIECLKLALSLTDPDSNDRGQVLTTFTAAYAALGNCAGCRRMRSEFIDLLHRRPSAILEAFYPHVEYNFAVAYHEIERFEEAEQAYLHARAACQRSEHPMAKALLPHVNHNLVDVFQELDRHQEAHSLMQLTYHLLPEDTHGAQMRNRRAIYALWKGDLPSAILWIESGLGHPSCDIRTRSALMLTKAKLAKASDDSDSAHDYAVEALRLAAAVQSSGLCSRISTFLNSP